MNVGIVGCGFVGLVTGVCLNEGGHRVVCIDQDPHRVAVIAAGRAPFYEPGLDALLERELATGRFTVTTDMTAVSGCDVVFLAVGTPTVNGAIDLSQVLAAAEAIAPHLAAIPAFPIVVVKSTVLPGTTDGPIKRILEAGTAGRANERFGLGTNPEFLREGCAVDDFRAPDRIVLGSHSVSVLASLRRLYSAYDCPILETTPSNAEFSKYASNALLATLVSFANDLATLSESLPGTDIERVTDSLCLDRRISRVMDGTRIIPGIASYLRAGAGFGGSCLPKDVAALALLAQETGCPSPMLEAVLKTNASRPVELLRLGASRLGTYTGRRIALLGLAFKPGTDDTRDSVAFVIAEQLQAAGAEVVAFDPMVRDVPSGRASALRLAPDAETALSGADAAFLVTAWPEFAALDWIQVADTMRRPLLIDGRNQLRDVMLPELIEYLPIGRAPTSLSNGPDAAADDG